jgi:hypothetical protein
VVDDEVAGEMRKAEACGALLLIAAEQIGITREIYQRLRLKPPDVDFVISGAAGGILIRNGRITHDDENQASAG